MKKIHNPVFNLPGKSMRFDIPLQARVGTEFLALLMALMTFLCILAGCINLSLNTMTRNWSEGLANTVTIEIPASRDDAAKINDLVNDLAAVENVTEARLVPKDELQALVEPWLGKGSAALTDLPVPSLISLKLADRTPEVIDRIKSVATGKIPEALIDAHDDWLSDILKISRGLQIAGAALILIIAIVTALTVSGAVRSRMAIHHAELELLHIMGASDRYITRQFQKYILVLSGKGILIGFILSVLTLALAYYSSAKMPETLPRFAIVPAYFYIVPVIAALLLFISVASARRTVMTVLKEMP